MRIVTAREQAEMREPWREAGANGDLPPLRYEHSMSDQTGRHRIKTFDSDRRIGWLDWEPGGEVENIEIHPDYQRRGVATEMWNRAKSIDPGIQHSSAQTAEGKAWAARTAARPRKIKPPWSDSYQGKRFPLQNQMTPDLIHMHDNLSTSLREGEPVWEGNEPHQDRLNNYTAEILDRHEAGDPEATDWAGRKGYAKADYMSDAEWDGYRKAYPEDYPVDPRPAPRTAVWREQAEVREPWREAAAEDWTPQIQHEQWDHRADGGFMGGQYTINHPTDPDNPAGFLEYKRNDGNRPYVAIKYLETHSDYPRQGIASALMQRLHADHPQYAIAPGTMTPEGQGFKDRMVQQHPTANDMLIARQRTAVWRDHPWLDDRDTVSTPMDPHADIQTYLRGAEDAYDEYANDFGTWSERVHAHPPDPTPTDVDWFHATSADLPVGTVLAPHKGKVPWLDNPYHGGLDNRANWTWVEYDLTHSDEWLGYMVRDHGEGHLYRVKPHIGPFPWNGDAREGWVTDLAVIVERVRDADGGDQRTASAGYNYHFDPDNRQSHMTPDNDATPASTLKWFSDGTVRNIFTDPAHRGKGLATELFNQTQQRYPDLQHSDDLTEDGREWSRKKFDHDPPPPDDPYDVEDTEGSTGEDWEIPPKIRETLNRPRETDEQMIERMRQEWKDKFGSHVDREYAHLPRDEQGRVLLNRGFNDSQQTYTPGPNPMVDGNRDDFHFAPPSSFDEAMSNIASENGGRSNVGNYWGTPEEAKFYAGDQGSFANDSSSREAHGAMAMSAWFHPEDIGETEDWQDGVGVHPGAQGEVAKAHVYHHPIGWQEMPDAPGKMVTASDVDDILDMLGPSPRPAKPAAPSPPPDPDRYYNHLKGQEDRTHTAHAWLPTSTVDHYREYDRPTNNNDYAAVKRAVSEDGIKLPLWISANDTHGMLVEGNNRLKAAKELGIDHLPVRFTYNHNVMRNEGTPVPHHPDVAKMMPQIKQTLKDQS